MKAICPNSGAHKEFKKNNIINNVYIETKKISTNNCNSINDTINNTEVFICSKCGEMAILIK